MLNIMIESILMAFVIGGIVGAVGALHLSKSHERRPAPIPAQRSRPGRHHRF